MVTMDDYEIYPKQKIPTGKPLIRELALKVANDPRLHALIRASDKYLDAIGYTEHGFRHTRLVAKRARELALTLGHTKRIAERAFLAGLTHDVGNFLGRHMHGVSSATLVYPILVDHGIEYDDITTILMAVANHEEEVGVIVDETGACLVIADKTDVHRSRVRYPDPTTQDIHDRVNLATKSCSLTADPVERLIKTEVIIDTAIASVMEYFEIFTSRMVMVRKSSRLLGCRFKLIINDTELS
jgi:metal-dependent HD superfamily phosphatase/phosphodiesterase